MEFNKENRDEAPFLTIESMDLGTITMTLEKRKTHYACSDLCVCNEEDSFLKCVDGVLHFEGDINHFLNGLYDSSSNIGIGSHTKPVIFEKGNKNG